MICRKCHNDKPEEMFNDDQRGNKRSDCTDCQSDYNAQYYLRNKEKIKSQQEEYRLNNIEQIMKLRKKRAERNETLKKIIYEVNTKYGAPMGRNNIGTKPNNQKVFDSYVPMDMMEPAYDKGGAYWGLSPNRLRVMYTKDLSFIKFYRENENN